MADMRCRADDRALRWVALMASVVSLLLAACGGSTPMAPGSPTTPVSAPSAAAAPCPATDTGDEDDPEQQPIFAPADAPASLDLMRPEDGAERLVLSGRIVTTACAPLAGASVLMVHASVAGAYEGPDGRMLYQGMLRTDAGGRYTVTTIRPGRYGANAVPHMHVMVNHPALPRPFGVTLFFPEPADIARLTARERTGVVPLAQLTTATSVAMRGTFDIVVPLP